MDFGAASFFLELALAVRQHLTSSSQSREQKRRLVETFEKALIETELSIQSVRKASGEGDHMESPERFRDRKIDEELARLWRRASVEFRGMEKSVARLAYSKSEFWIDRDYWTRNGITLSGIAIEDAKKVISEMKF